MWKEYSFGYIKNNRASGLSVMTAAFISALLLSLLGSIFYNLWIYEVERLKAEEGDWQGRIVGAVSEENLALIRNHANVDRIVINEEADGESDGQGMTTDIYFRNMRGIFEDLPHIAELAGLPAEAAEYHYALLNLYLIRGGGDSALRWVFPFTLSVTAMACLSLILVIHNAFAVSMDARVHQFGIFSSVGATPGQIRTCLLQEAAVLCAVPVAAGSLFGILISMGIVEAVNMLLKDVEGRLMLPFCYHPLLLVLSLLASAVTLWISAWIPARRMSRLTPLEAIRNTGELSLKRKKNSRILRLLFGIEGELAGNALKAQRKAMRTAALSLIFSFLAFSLMMCFLTVTIVSQQETYFARYQDAWDVMAAVKNTEIADFGQTEELQKLPGVQSAVVYRKAAAKRIVTAEEISDEMRAAGGLENAPAEYAISMPGSTEVSEDRNVWLVNAPLIILDDASFLEYCEQIGAKPRLDGAVILNLARDAADPNFRKRRSFPYLAETGTTTLLGSTGQEIQYARPEVSGQEATAAKLSVIAYAQEPPVLREEYGTLDFYELVHFLPVSVWKEIKDRIGGAESDLLVRILAEEETAEIETETEKQRRLDVIEEAVSQLLGRTYEIETENRLEELAENKKMFAGMKAVVSLFCGLLAVIGIGSVFSNTLGFVRVRRREFARYLSLGLTPGGMNKIFCVEALVVAGRPVLTALPVTAAVAALFLKASYLEPILFIREAPFGPILAFILAIFGFVALAYYLGAKKLLGSSLADALRDDTML